MQAVGYDFDYSYENEVKGEKEFSRILSVQYHYWMITMNIFRGHQSGIYFWRLLRKKLPFRLSGDVLWAESDA